MSGRLCTMCQTAVEEGHDQVCVAEDGDGCTGISGDFRNLAENPAGRTCFPRRLLSAR